MTLDQATPITNQAEVKWPVENDRGENTAVTCLHTAGSAGRGWKCREAQARRLGAAAATFQGPRRCSISRLVFE